MRTHNTWGLLLLIIGFSLAGCSDSINDPDEERYYGSGTIISEQRSVGAFTGIRITNFGSVIVTQSATESLRIEVDDNLVDRVTTTVQSGVLHVGLKRGSYDNLTLRVYVSMKTVTSLDIVGVGEIHTASPITADKLSCTITGTGTMTLTGTAAQQTVLITGAGNIYNFDLMSVNCAATISGAGNIEVTATQFLGGAITGVGSIIYDGNPTTVSKTITGVGTIRPR